MDRDGVDAVAAMLARSFDDDPVWSHIFPDPVSRPRRLRQMFAVLVSSRLRCGDRVRVVADAHAAALWGPPEHPHFTGRETLAQFPRMFRAFGPRGLRFLPDLRALDALAAQWKDRPHWYLDVLGVDPSRQRSGLGSALIADTLDRADAQGLGAYLLSSKEENIAFYGRHGFGVVSTHTFDDGPTAWGMWRESRV